MGYEVQGAECAWSRLCTGTQYAQGRVYMGHGVQVAEGGQGQSVHTAWYTGGSVQGVNVCMGHDVQGAECALSIVCRGQCAGGSVYIGAECAQSRVFMEQSMHRDRVCMWCRVHGA